jgi:hypothetical protein
MRSCDCRFVIHSNKANRRPKGCQSILTTPDILRQSIGQGRIGRCRTAKDCPRLDGLRGGRLLQDGFHSYREIFDGQKGDLICRQKKDAALISQSHRRCVAGRNPSLQRPDIPAFANEHPAPPQTNLVGQNVQRIVSHVKRRGIRQMTKRHVTACFKMINKHM